MHYLTMPCAFGRISLAVHSEQIGLIGADINEEHG